MGFSFIDWSILAASLLLVFYVGLIGRRYVKDTSDFLVAGRRMGVHVGTISLLSTEIGMITYMYYAEMGVLYGFTAFIVGVLSGGAYYFLGTTGFVIKKFRELELVTIPQYFEQKYSRRLRVLVGILMAVGGALNFGVFPIIEAKFLNIVTGIPQDYIIWTMVLLILMVLVYTVMGGMVSVLVTNYVQYIVLATGMVIVSFYCFYIVGWDPMVETVENQMGKLGFDPLVHPTFGWKFIFWQAVALVAGLVAWAPIVVRAFSSENPEVGKKIFRRTGLLFLGRAILPMMWGIATLAYFKGQQFVPIEGTPLFLRDVLPIGIKGLVVAGMLAASMSTYSGYLLAWSSIISEDIVIPLRNRPLKAHTQLLINRITVGCLAAFIIVWGLFYVVPAATYFYLQMTANIFLAGTFWSLVGGLYWKKAHPLGAYSALIMGGSVTAFFFFIPNPEEWTGFIGVASYLLAFAGMVAGSFIGTHVQSLTVRAGLLVSVVLALFFGLYAYVTAPAEVAGWLVWPEILPEIVPEIWLNLWIVIALAAAILFVTLSAYTIAKGFNELRVMLRQMLSG